MTRATHIETRGIVILFTVLVLLSSAAYSSDLSNKWRIKVNHSAKSDGKIVFRVSPKGQAPIDVTVEIKKGTRENKVAIEIRDEFKYRLSPKKYHIERDDWEDVLIKRRGDTPNFGLELISNSVQKVSINLRKE